MAHSCGIHFLLLLLSISLFSTTSCSSLSSPSPSPNKQPSSFILPISKDPETNLYYATMAIGTPQHKMNLVIDLGGSNLWYICNSRYNSSTYNPISCKSDNCPTDSFCSSCSNNGLSKTGCSNTTCASYITNPFSSSVGFIGDTAQDVMIISKNRVSGILSVCTDPERFNGDHSESSILKGLPKSSKGMLGLAFTALSLEVQFQWAPFNLPVVFFLCLPSSNKKGLGGGGSLFFGGAPHNSSIISSTTPFNALAYEKSPTPISGEKYTYEYQIFVESIKVGGKVLNLKPSLFTTDRNGNGGSKISTVDPFTVLHSSIYKPLVREFVKQANKRNMKQVAKVKPFEACFDMGTIGMTKTGVDVPRIDLVLAEGAVWTIYGGNSMVIVDDDENVACLGFVDGGKNPKKSIVIGGHQLEENLLEISMVTDGLGFSSSLLLYNASCSQFTS